MCSIRGRLTLVARSRFLMAATAAAGLAIGPAAAQTVTEKAERDEIATVAKSDPVMAAAMHKAQAELPGFLALSVAPQPGMKGFAVKVAIREGQEAEYFWIGGRRRLQQGAGGVVPLHGAIVEVHPIDDFGLIERNRLSQFHRMHGPRLVIDDAGKLSAAGAEWRDEFKRHYRFSCDF